MSTDLTCKEALQALLMKIDYSQRMCRLTDMVGACVPSDLLEQCHKALYDELSPRQALELLEQAKDHLQHTRCKDEDASKCPACGLEATIEMYISSNRRLQPPVSEEIVSLLEGARNQFQHYYNEFSNPHFTDRYDDARTCKAWVTRLDDAINKAKQRRGPAPRG